MCCAICKRKNICGSAHNVFGHIQRESRKSNQKSNYRFATLSFFTIYPICETEYKGPIIGQQLVGSVLDVLG